MSISDFHNFVLNISNTPEFERLNGYTTVLMCNHNNVNDIMNYRKQWFVNNFTNFNNIENQKYYDYYDKNITDSFSGNFAPPPCFLNTHDRYIREDEQRIEKENQNDDVYWHYVYVSNKYSSIVQFEKLTNEDPSDYENSLYESEYESSENVSLYSDIDDYNYNEDYNVEDEEIQYEDDYDY